MMQIWIIYNLLVTITLIYLSLSSARSIPQFLLPLLLLPLLYHLLMELRRKPRYRKIKDPSIYASTTGARAPIIEPDLAQPTLLEEVKESAVSDIDRRLFLKLIGSTGVTMTLMALFTKDAKAAFFGSMPGPGTVAIKDSAGAVIDPAQMQPTDGYTITEVDDGATTAYYGFVHKTGAWYITKENGDNGSYRYAKGGSSFSTNWTNRASLTYDYFDNVF